MEDQKVRKIDLMRRKERRVKIERRYKQEREEDKWNNTMIEREVWE